MTHLSEIVEQFGTGEATSVVVQMVERALRVNQAKQEEQRAAEGKSEKSNPWVTDAGKQCDRAVVLSLQNAEAEPFSTDSLVNFGIGHAVEEWLAGCIDTLGLPVRREVRVEIPIGTTKVTGRIDFLITPHDNKTGGLIELKSTSSRAMGFMLKNGEQGRTEHRKQLNLYMHASQRGLIEDLPAYDKGYLVYCVKDATMREPVIHAFQVDYDELEAMEDLYRLARLKEQADRDVVPGIPDGYKWSRWPCAWCSYRPICHGGAR